MPEPTYRIAQRLHARRAAVGLKKYGQHLSAESPGCMLVHALEEAADQVNYLIAEVQRRQKLMKWLKVISDEGEKWSDWAHGWFVDLGGEAALAKYDEILGTGAQDATVEPDPRAIIAEAIADLSAPDPRDEALRVAEANASLVGTWEHAARKAAGEDGVQFVGPNTIFAVSDKLRADRDALAADNARLRAALEEAFEGAARQLAEPRNHDDDQYALTAIATTCEAALAATPAQSLAAHDAAVKVAVLDQIKARLYSLASKEQDQPYGYDMNPRQWAATCLECAAEDVTAMQDEIISEAGRIEKEAA